MFQALIRTVSKCTIAAIVISSSLFAKDIPITNTITLYVPMKEYSVIEFPFKIKDKKASPFYSMVKIKKENKKTKSSVKVPTFDKALIQKKIERKTKRNRKKKAPIIINVGANNIQLYPLALGNMEFVVWGYKKFPLMLKIIVDKNLGDKYYRFIDYSIDKKKAVNFESDSHERIISKITKALFTKKLPRGFTSESHYSKFTSEKLEFVLVQVYSGKRYVGEEWRVTNMSKDRTKLYPEQIFNDDIYSVSFENDVLKSGETTRMFIVRRYTNN